MESSKFLKLRTGEYLTGRQGKARIPLFEGRLGQRATRPRSVLLEVEEKSKPPPSKTEDGEPGLPSHSLGPIVLSTGLRLRLWRWI